MAYDLKKAFRISRLIARKQTGALGETEERELAEWLSGSGRNSETYSRIVSGPNEESYGKWKRTEHRAPLHRMNVRIAARRNARRRGVAFGAAAAGVAACLLVMLSIFPGKTDEIAGIYPGDTKATLILASGEAHDLSSSTSMYLSEAGVAITKGNETSLSYNVAVGREAEEEPVYHEIRIGRGGEFDLELADGTHVWLNSESSLRYPVAFTGGERRVFLTGEAYFEVARDGQKQFVIESGGQTARVLGTSLNITAYPGAEKIVTTLISGKVSVAHATGEPVVLAPGEQSQLDVENGAVSVGKVDIVGALAWRSGWFILDNQTLEQFMTQVARWYDFETVYVNEDSRTMEFIGKVPRYGEFDQVLNVLRQSSDLNISVSDKTVYIE